MEACSVVLTFESVDKICTVMTIEMKSIRQVLFHGKTCVSIFYKINFRISYEFLSLAFLAVKGVKTY